MANRKRRLPRIVTSTAYALVTGVIVTVLGQWTVNLIWPSEAPMVDVADLMEQSPISLARWQQMTLELNRAPEDVRERLFDDYRGESVTWAGYFERATIHPDAINAPSSAISLIMYDSRESLDSDQLLGPPFIRCFFSKQQQADIAQLQRGQRVVVRGTLANPTLIGTVLATDLNKCELIATEDAMHELAILPGAPLR